MNGDDEDEPVLLRALSHPRYEIVPLRSGLEAALALPPGATVSVTCSPAQGLDSSLEFALNLADRGLHVIPHLAARRVRNRAHLVSIMTRLHEAGLRDIFVVAGDHTDRPGAYDNGLALIRELQAMSVELDTIGVPAYPEGHPFLRDATLIQALQAKAPYATYMVTQLCFDGALLRRWLRQVRDGGLSLPVYIGIPGALDRRRLLGIVLRIGLGDSVRFVRKHSRLTGGLLGSSRYAPDDLLTQMSDGFADPELHIAGFHINTFNQVQATEEWRLSYLERHEQPVSSTKEQSRIGSAG